MPPQRPAGAIRSKPSRVTSVKARQDPSMKTSPWAKLISSIIP